MNSINITPWAGLKVLIPGDMHAPFTDMGAVGAMAQIFACQGDSKDLGVVIQGDLHEASALSSYSKSAKRQTLSIGQEIEAASHIFGLLGWWGGPKVFIPGNHEQRAERFLADNPGTISDSVRDYWRIPFDWTCLGWRGRVQMGPLTICHGDTLKGSLSGSGPQTVLRRYPTRSTIYGHTHRMQAAYHTTYNAKGQPEVHGAWSVGHLCDVDKLTDMGYGVEENWQVGFSVVHFYGVKKFHVVQYLAIGRSFHDPICGEVTW